MGYMPADCGKCLRVIENKKGFYCTALERYIFNRQVTGIYLVESSKEIPFNDPDTHGGRIINGSKEYDSKCDFKPTNDYNIADYYEPLDDRCPPWSGNRDNY